jgi:glycosyltransferase involved in cell wall biosynthesis
VKTNAETMSRSGQVRSRVDTGVRELATVGITSCTSASQVSVRHLLIVCCTVPYPPTNGQTMRSWAILRGLASIGCEIDLLAFGKPVDSAWPQLNSVCRRVEFIPHSAGSLSQSKDYLRRLRSLASPLPYGVTRFFSETMAATIRDRLQAREVDAILCDSPFPLVNFPAALPAPLVINSHNVEHLLLKRYLACESNLAKRGYAWLEWRRTRSWERGMCQRASLVMACSEADRVSLAELCPGLPISIVPNVLDIERYAPTTEQSLNQTVLYAGGMDWLPNRDAVAFFVSRIWPELRKLTTQVNFVVAGRNAPEEFQERFKQVDGVRFAGHVPDMQAEIAKAAVCVVPLRIGSGTRLKILEAAAMARPVVSTRIGAEGLNFIEDEEIFLADEPEDFARKVAALLANPDLRQRVGRSARRRVEREYSLAVLPEALNRSLAVVSQVYGRHKVESVEEPNGPEERT